MINDLEIIIFEAFITISSPMTLGETGASLSRHLFGGVAFVETDEFDEFPGLKLLSPVIGMSATLVGANGKFTLRLSTEANPYYHINKNMYYQFIQIKNYILQCMSLIPNLTAA